MMFCVTLLSDVGSDMTFTFNNLPPGKYLVLVDTASTTLTKLRQPESAAARTKLRRTAEAKKNEIELKPCQNLTDYQLKHISHDSHRCTDQNKISLFDVNPIRGLSLLPRTLTIRKIAC